MASAKHRFKVLTQLVFAVFCTWGVVSLASQIVRETLWVRASPIDEHTCNVELNRLRMQLAEAVALEAVEQENSSLFPLEESPSVRLSSRNTFDWVFHRRSPNPRLASKEKISRIFLFDSLLGTTDAKPLESFFSALGLPFGRPWDIQNTRLFHSCPFTQRNEAYSLAQLRAAYETTLRHQRNILIPLKK